LPFACVIIHTHYLLRITGIITRLLIELIGTTGIFNISYSLRGVSTMKTKIPVLLVIAILLVAVIGGCTGYKKGIEGPRLLSGVEKSELVRIALNTDEVKNAMEHKEFYQIEIGWSLIKWRDDGSNVAEIGYYDYNYEEFRARLEKEMSGGAELYSAVKFEMGEPIDYGVNVSINPDSLQIVNVITIPLTPVNNRAPEK
jgi:hypothetical protein